MRDLLSTKVNFVICLFGLLGNVLNLVILAQRGLFKRMSRMEKSANSGLMALAVSDMLFCAAVIPGTFVDHSRFSYSSRYDMGLLYELYSNCVINTFIMSSTWLTVTMAVSRYVAICHPLRARQVIGATFAGATVLLVFVACIVCNLPRFWNDRLESIDCREGGSQYFPTSGYLKRHKRVGVAYLWSYFVVAVFLPLVALTFCNLNLINALRQSAAMRRRYNRAGREGTAASEPTDRITMTLVIIVVMYVLLVTPAELCNFVSDIIIRNASGPGGFNLAVAFSNTLQSINFAVNFVLYCVVNTHFRRGVYALLCWPSRAARGRGAPKSSSAKLQHQPSNLETPQSVFSEAVSVM
ncbi:hypothetical protein NP493_1344g00017 [Ridgeia piscesae]|uniref:G-protein coupled receptors family 1 profile domain-containing protein n=1 Tax=Ridgeia piscesae TaxID=27915 RepID=A0AAD9K8I6_RIDPI|nr:hypothetical protein NP493_1344g00017 [Ridgeia piscesae]